MLGWFLGAGPAPRQNQAEAPNNAGAAAPAQAQPSVARLRELRQLQNERRGDGAPSPWWRPGVMPLAPGGQQMNVVAQGPADNAVVIGGLGAVGVVLQPSIVRGVDIPPFDAQVIQQHELDINGLVTASCVCTLLNRQREVRVQQLILDTMAPDIPEDLVLDARAARDALWALLDNANLLLDQPWFVDGVAGLAAAGHQAHAAMWAGQNWAGEAALRQPGQAGAGAQAPPAAAAVGNAERDRALAHRLDVLYHIAQAMDDRHRGRAMYPVVLTLLAFALRGEITQSKLAKIQRELNLVMPFAVEHLSREDIAMTWRNFGHYVNDGTIGPIILRWIRALPAGGIRLRVVLNQASGSGMTSLDVIARAIHLHQHFPWHMIQRLYPEDWGRAVHALRRVAGNPYFGYRGELGEVRAALYRPISWVCGRLLILAGDKTLGEYRGFQPDAKYKDIIETLIEDYLKAQDVPDLTSDPTADEYGGFDDLVQLVALHPANL